MVACFKTKGRKKFLLSVRRYGSHG